MDSCASTPHYPATTTCAATQCQFSQCLQLVSEISTIVGGVEKIEGDQVTKATFYFAHAMVEGCDRVVGSLSAANRGGLQPCFAVPSGCLVTAVVLT